MVLGKTVSIQFFMAGFSLMKKSLISIFPNKLGRPGHSDAQLEFTIAKQQQQQTTQQMKSARQRK